MQLSDSQTCLHVQGITSAVSTLCPSIHLKDTNNPYHTLLSKFPSLTQVCSPNDTIKHDITHFIDVSGSLVSDQPKRLASDRLRITKPEFEHMLQLSIIRPSSRAWSSALHKVPKRTSGYWHPCGDYHAPCMTFSSSLPGATIFFKLDLVRAYLKISVNH